MESNRKITIVTPVFNAEKDIETCILSVAHQTYQNKEHLIVDGASTDGTLAIVKGYAEKYSHIRFISEKDNGIYDAMNKAIDLASGDWIYFLGCDDVFYNDTVLEEIFNIDGIDLFDVVYGNVLWGDSGKIYDGKFSTLKLMDENICHQAILYKHSIFGNLGKFDTRYKIWADYLFNIKWFNCDEVRSRYVSSIVAKYGINGHSSQMEDIDFLRDRESIYKQNFPLEYLLIREKLHYLDRQLAEREGLLSERDQQLAERDRQLAEREGLLSERDQHLAERDRQLTEKEGLIINLQTSLSWRLTAPLRRVLTTIQKLLHPNNG